MVYFLYILEMLDGRLYVGVTQNLSRRQSHHGNDPSTQTTYIFGAGPIIYHEKLPDLTSALKRERQIKRWSRAKKMALVKGDTSELKRFSKSRKF